MKLKEYEATKDSNIFWRLGSGDHLNLLEEAIAERNALAEQVEELKAAINNCINYANNRETEWGSRAESAFEYLYKALERKEVEG